MSIVAGLECPYCGRNWHPPALCWAYDWLDVEIIERIAANAYNAVFEEWDIERQRQVWEGEGGR